MSSRDGNQELHGDGDGDVQRNDDAPKADGDNLGAKDAVVARIKHNFYLETQAFRKRILDATDEASRARERVDSFQEEMLRVKKKCFKLKKLLAERDATIQFLHEQQEVSFPIMMSETMRNIHAHMGDNNNNQQQEQDDDLNQAPLSISRMREQVQDRAAVDDQIHEYETQIAQLYTEIQDEKQKNEMLSECLREQKHTKAKLMKACKYAKQEIEALKNNGMKQMLEDMQSKCQELEAENERLVRELADEKLKVTQIQDSHDTVARELAFLREAESNREDMIRGKDDELAKFREQIHAQQMLIENMEFDMRSKRRTRRSSFEEQDDNEDSEDAREERELLTRALQAERSRLKDAEQEIKELRVKTESLEHSLHANQSYFTTPTNSRGYARGGASRTDTGENLDDLLKTAQQLRTKVSVLHQLLRSYVETDAIDMQLLAGETWREGGGTSFAEPDSVSHLTTESCETRLRVELLHAKRGLSELQQLVEDACATAMGSSCTFQ